LLLLCDRQQKGCCCFQGRHGGHAVMVMVMDGDVDVLTLLTVLVLGDPERN
jgi:hypothetical protein